MRSRNALVIAAALLAAPFLVRSDVYSSSAVGANGRSSKPLSAPSYTATVGSGANGFACATNGCRVDFGAGASDYASSDGTTVTFAGPVTTGSTLTIADGPNSTLSAAGASTNFAFSGGSGAPPLGDGISAGYNKTMNTGNNIMGFYDGTTRMAGIDKTGYLKSKTPETLFSAYVNALLATGTTYGGHVPEKAFTVTAVHTYVSVVASGAGNDVFTITDGTNTCTATFSCTTSFNATGAKTVATANGAGTGCVYAASAALSISLTTAGCATTQGTIKNLDVVGNWQ